MQKKSNNNLNIKYGKLTKGWTSQMCKFLAKNNNDVQKLIDHIHTNKNPRSSSRSLLDQKAISKNINLYETTLPILTDYYNRYRDLTQNDTIALHYILSKVYAQLKNFTGAYYHEKEISKMLFHYALSANSDLFKLNTNLSKRMVKHQLIQARPLISTTTSSTPEEILVSKTYIDEREQGKREEFAKKLKEVYTEFKLTKFSELILRMSALITTEEGNTFGIFVSPEIKAPEPSLGYYSYGNKIYITETIQQALTNSHVKMTFFHELVHYIMNKLFRNACKPYARDDKDAEKAYKHSMYQIILNTVNFIYPKDILEKMERNKFHTLKIKNDLFSFQLSKVKCPHSWNQLLSLEELIENCYGEHGILKGLSGVMIMSTHLSDESLSALLIGRELENCFAGHSPSVYQAEFITLMTTQLLSIPFYGESQHFKPFKNYLEHLISIMEAYIKQHPRPSMIEEPKAIINSNHKKFIILTFFILLVIFLVCKLS